jgi:DNA-binding GntR family transcriptional regulator
MCNSFHMSTSNLPRGRPATTSEEAYDLVRAEIVSGALMPGDVVVELRLAEFLKISRTPVREALLRLEREGLLQRSGRSLSVRIFTPEEVSDIYTVRAHVESFAARLAAERGMPHEITELKRLHASLVAATERYHADANLDELRTITQVNERFHTLLITMARSPALAKTTSSLMLTPLLYRSQQWYEHSDRLALAQDHQALLDAIDAGDPAAVESCWREHLLTARDRILAKQLARGHT